MPGVVIYGVGSPLVVEAEESLARAGHAIVAAIRNHPAPNHFRTAAPVFACEAAPEEVRALPFLVPLFRPANRRHAAQEARRHGFRVAFALVDPTTTLPRELAHGEGLYVNARCIVGAGTAFGAFVLLNRGANVGHHCRLEDFVSLGPGAILCGGVTVRSQAMVGAGAVVLPEVTIGEAAQVGAGAVVTRDVPAGARATGNPARWQAPEP